MSIPRSRATFTLPELEAFLAQLGVVFKEEPVQYGGTMLRCEGGTVLTFWPKRGGVLIQGVVTSVSGAVRTFAAARAAAHHPSSWGSAPGPSGWASSNTEASA